MSVGLFRKRPGDDRYDAIASERALREEWLGLGLALEWVPLLGTGLSIDDANLDPLLTELRSIAQKLRENGGHPDDVERLVRLLEEGRAQGAEMYVG